jgi:hypothetical protein
MKGVQISPPTQDNKYLHQSTQRKANIKKEAKRGLGFCLNSYYEHWSLFICDIK